MESVVNMPQDLAGDTDSSGHDDVQREFNRRLLEAMSAAVVACDADGQLSLFNSTATAWHGTDVRRLPPEQWSAHYDLYAADGVTPLRTEQIPLLRAFNGESVRDAVLTIVARGQPPRQVECNGDALIGAGGERIGAVVVMHDVTDRNRMQQSLEHKAYFDDLTGLANRRQLTDALERLAATPDPGVYGLMLVDIDGFKTVNDTLGHSVGDALICAVARRMDARFADAALVARLGGDEFCLVLDAAPDAETMADRLRVAGRRLTDAFTQAFDISGHSLRLSGSVGLAMIDPGQPGDPLAQADLAMYAAKARGRGYCEFYRDQLRIDADAQHQLHERLRHAVTHDTLRVIYQPQFDASGRVVGAEALLRWHDGTREIPPGEFVPLAERLGLMPVIDTWVVDHVFSQMADWRRQCPQTMVPIAVNVSAREFDDDGFVEQLLTSAERHGIDTAMVYIEVTEGALLEDADTSAAVLQRLRTAGFRIALDDFGTGFSSLNYLARIPVEHLKIDQSFVAAIGCSARAEVVIDAIVSMAGKLDLQVIAEGVETDAQLDFLRTLGCQFFQGMRFDAGVDASEFQRRYLTAPDGAG